MNRIIALLVVLLCTAHTISLAQVVSIDSTIITFDKLSKTVIPFTASKKPIVKIVPDLRGSPNTFLSSGERLSATVTFAKGKGTITVAYPLPAGKYLITLTDGKKTAEAQWIVLSKPNVYLQSYAYIGKKLSGNIRLTPELSRLERQLVLSCKIGSAPPLADIPFARTWQSNTLFPAFAKKATLSLVWVYPPTGERIVLSEEDIRPKQTPPILLADSVTAAVVPGSLRSVKFKSETDTDSTETSTLDFDIRGIALSAKVPVDVDPSDSTKPIYGTLGDIEADDLKTATSSYDQPMVVRVGYGESYPIDSLSLIQGKYDAANGSYLIIVRVHMPKLPAFAACTLEGNVALNVRAMLWNRRAGAVGSLFYETVKAPVRFAFSSPTSTAGMIPLTRRMQMLCEGCTEPVLRNPVWKVCSPVLRENVQRLAVATGRNVAPETIAPNAEVLVSGAAKSDGTYALSYIRVGKELITSLDMNNLMPDALRKALSEPVLANGTQGYCWEALPPARQALEQTQATEAIHEIISKNYPKSVLRKLDFFRSAGYAIYEADSALTYRWRESFTPVPYIDPSIAAECENSDEIKMRISKGQQVPREMMDDMNCESVMRYYQVLASMVQIERAYIIVNMREAEPKIIGMVSTAASLFRTNQGTDKFSLQSSYIVLDGSDLKQFKTKEFEKNDKTGALVAVNGSMLKTNAENLYDYCMDGLRKGLFTERTAEVSNVAVVRNRPGGKDASVAVRPAPAPSDTKGTTAAALTAPAFAAPGLFGFAIGIWSVCDGSVQTLLRSAFTKAGKTKTQGDVFVYGAFGQDSAAGGFMVLCGNDVMDKAELRAVLKDSVLEYIARPQSASGTALYCHTILSLQQELEKRTVITNLRSEVQIPTKQALLHFADYAYSNISLFETDPDAVMRFREVLTPSLARPAALDSAEEKCERTDEIKWMIKIGQPVRQAYILDLDSPEDCEFVKNYYLAMARNVQIGKVYVVTKRYKYEGEMPEILGVISIPTAPDYRDPDFLRNALLAPLSVGTLTAEELRDFKTREVVKDNSTGEMVDVKGSIENTSYERMLDYFSVLIRQGWPDRISLLQMAATKGFQARLRRELEEEARKRR